MKVFNEVQKDVIVIKNFCIYRKLIISLRKGIKNNNIVFLYLFIRFNKNKLYN